MKNTGRQKVQRKGRAEGVYGTSQRGVKEEGAHFGENRVCRGQRREKVMICEQGKKWMQEKSVGGAEAKKERKEKRLK